MIDNQKASFPQPNHPLWDDEQPHTWFNEPQTTFVHTPQWHERFNKYKKPALVTIGLIMLFWAVGNQNPAVATLGLLFLANQFLVQ